MTLFTVGHRDEITRSGEWHRIAQLPRRVFSDADAEHIRREFTQLLRRPGSKFELRTIQALALHEIAICNGAVCVMRVGSGKTVVSLMSAAVIHPSPKNPLIITKASLVDKTKMDRDDLMREGLLLPRGVDIASYEILGRASGADFLERVKRPDLIVLDEGHMAKNLKAGVVRRLARYLERFPDTIVVDLSGTFFKASLKDAAHRITWALKQNSPVPAHKVEIEQWANALDAESRVSWTARVGPGALLDFCEPEDWVPRDGETHVSPIVAARRGFQRRLVQTPGVVATGGEQVACSLNILGSKFDVSQATEDNFKKLRKTWSTPDDWELVQAVEVWACARQLALGFHYVWSPRPPDEWRNLRKQWGKFVRTVLKQSKTVRLPDREEPMTLDTPGQVATAARAGVLHDDGLHAAWSKIEPTFKPNSVAVWHDETVLYICAKWMEKHKGVVWTEHSFFARELSRRTGVAYYGRDGKDKDGNSLDVLAKRVLAREIKPVPVIASIKANATGRNLQGWDDNLITSIPTEAAIWEQLLGRTHRDGQQSDEVNVAMLFGCHEHIDGWGKAVELARAIQDTEGSSQKLLIATKVVPPGLESLPGSRWQKTSEDDEVDD